MGKQLEDLPPEVLLNIVSNFCCCESNCDKIVDADTIPREDSPLKHLNVNCHDHGTLASLCRTSKRLGVYATEHLYHVLNFRYDAIMSELVEGAPPSVRTREKSALCLLETVASRPHLAQNAHYMCFQVGTCDLRGRHALPPNFYHETELKLQQAYRLFGYGTVRPNQPSRAPDPLMLQRFSMSSSSDFVSLLLATAKRLGLDLPNNWWDSSLFQLDLLFLQILLLQTPKVKTLDLVVEPLYKGESDSMSFSQLRQLLWPATNHVDRTIPLPEPASAFRLNHLSELTISAGGDGMNADAKNPMLCFDFAPIMKLAPNLHSLTLVKYGCLMVLNPNTPLANITALYIKQPPNLFWVGVVLAACGPLTTFYLDLGESRMRGDLLGVRWQFDQGIGFDMGVIIDLLKKHTGTLRTLGLMEEPYPGNRPRRDITELRELVNVETLFLTLRCLRRERAATEREDPTLADALPASVQRLHLTDCIGNSLVCNLQALDHALERGQFEHLREIVLYQTEGRKYKRTNLPCAFTSLFSDSSFVSFRRRGGLLYCKSRDRDNNLKEVRTAMEGVL